MKLVISAIPLFLGGVIYILYREHTLVMFSWFSSLGLTDLINGTRELAGPSVRFIPEWVIFSLPNALWVLSGTLIFSHIWEVRKKEKIFWISIFVFLAVGSEIGQHFKLIAGSYDHADLLLMLVAVALALKLTSKPNCLNDEERPHNI